MKKYSLLISVALTCKCSVHSDCLPCPAATT